MEKIIIDKNQDLNLNFEKNKDSSTEIIIKENIKCNLNIFTNSNAKQEIRIKLEQNSQLNHNSITINTKETFCKIEQKNNSKYKNQNINFANNTNFNTNNSTTLNEENSYSDIKIINIAQNSSNISSEGLIHIKEESINSEGHQKIIGIILDDESSIQAQPNLEVENNEVICSHGASITQIDEDKLFYLNSKGFNKQQSINLIIHGYFDNLLSKTNPEFQEQTKQKLEQKNII